MATSKHSGAKQSGASAPELISKRIADLGDWRGKTLAHIRALMKEALPDVLEEWKWMGTPVWSHNGIVCTGESYKDKVKMTFAKGAFLKDPSGLFNSSLDGNQRRAIDISEGQKINTSALKALFVAAAALNAEGKKKKAAPKTDDAPAPAPMKVAPYKPAGPAKKAPAKRAPKTKSAPKKRGR